MTQQVGSEDTGALNVVPLPLLSVVLPFSLEDSDNNADHSHIEWRDVIFARLAEVELIEVVRGRGKTRGERLQDGINACRADMILLHHPRSLIDREGIEWLRDNAATLSWGGFTHAFDSDHFLLRFTSWYSNRVRAARGVLYLDHCIFFKRELLTRPIPPVPIFEDTELSYILRESSGTAPVILPFSSVTSSVRFATNGVFWQAILNQWMKLNYLLGRSYHDMNSSYERGLQLNDANSVNVKAEAEAEAEAATIIAISKKSKGVSTLTWMLGLFLLSQT